MAYAADTPGVSNSDLDLTAFKTKTQEEAALWCETEFNGITNFTHTSPTFVKQGYCSNFMTPGVIMEKYTYDKVPYRSCDTACMTTPGCS